MLYTVVLCAVARVFLTIAAIVHSNNCFFNEDIYEDDGFLFFSCLWVCASIMPVIGWIAPLFCFMGGYFKLWKQWIRMKREKMTVTITAADFQKYYRINKNRWKIFSDFSCLYYESDDGIIEVAFKNFFEYCKTACKYIKSKNKEEKLFVSKVFYNQLLQDIKEREQNLHPATLYEIRTHAPFFSTKKKEASHNGTLPSHLILF